MTTPLLPTAEEMRDIYTPVISANWMAFAHIHWPALIAMREELEHLRSRQKYWAEDERDITQMEAELAAAKQEIERLKKPAWYLDDSGYDG